MPFKTPLYEEHIALNATMINFNHWEMPLHYGSQINEHQAVRQHSGMFDVSHMTIVDILGAGGRLFLRNLLTNDVDSIKHPGRALYSCMCNEHGGIIDDLIVYQRAPDNYRIVLNSATRDSDFAWIRKNSEGFSVGLQERKDLAMLAVQGPEAIEKTLKILNPSQLDAVSTLTAFESVDIGDWFFAKTGYTGEDGFEIIVPNDTISRIWVDLLAAGVQPCGLGARDTLRLEAGMLLYGQDMDETITPLDVGLEWTVKWLPENRNFIGMGALLSQKQQGINQKLIGLILQGKGIMRSGQQVFVNDQPQGIITSGSYSPTLGKSIAMARVPTNIEGQVEVEIRDKLIPAIVRKPRFVKRGQIIDD